LSQSQILLICVNIPKYHVYAGVHLKMFIEMLSSNNPFPNFHIFFSFLLGLWEAADPPNLTALTANRIALLVADCNLRHRNYGISLFVVLRTAYLWYCVLRGFFEDQVSPLDYLWCHIMTNCFVPYVHIDI